MIEVRLQSFVLRALIGDLQLARPLLAVEPQADCCNHRWYNQQLHPLPQRNPEG
jgi:hypothetical protein